MDEIFDKTIISCYNCLNKLRIPTNKGKILVTCPICKEKFTYKPDTKYDKFKRKFQILGLSLRFNLKKILKFALIIGVTGFILFYIFSSGENTNNKSNIIDTCTNITTSYDKSFVQKNTGGYSTVTINNLLNSDNYLVKIYSLKDSKAECVRQFYIKGGDSFKASTLTSGLYDIRFKNLSTNLLFKSQVFELTEKMEQDGIEYMDYSMTLYKVYDGNARTYKISDKEFYE